MQGKTNFAFMYEYKENVKKRKRGQCLICISLLDVIGGMLWSFLLPSQTFYSEYALRKIPVKCVPILCLKQLIL